MTGGQGSRDTARVLSPPPARDMGWETATVTTTSPFRVQLADGTELTDVPRLRSSLPAVGDVVAVRRLGGDRLVLDAIDPKGPPVTTIGNPLANQGGIPPGETTPLTFVAGDVSVDSHSMANPANNRVEPSIDGTYLITLNARTAGTVSDGTRMVLAIRIGGTNRAFEDNVQGGQARWGGSLATTCYLPDDSAGYVDATIFHTHGANIELDWTYSLSLLRAGMS